MRRLLSALLALAFAIPPVAAAEDLPGYYGGGTGGSIRIHSIALTDRQPAGVYTFGTAFPIASMDFNRGSAFSGVLYACDTNDPDTDRDNDLSDEAGCQSLATLNADSWNSTMRARKLVYALDINTAETAGNTSRLTIKGSFDQVSSGSAPQVDSDGDGLYEYLRFPFDYDGDGTSAVTCSGAGSPDDACAFSGEQVWPDFIDDFNAADDMLAAGGTLDCVGDWLLPVRAKACSGGSDSGLSCNLDADCGGGGTCEWYNDGYQDRYSFASGEPRSSTAPEVARLPAAQKAGASYYFGAPDLNAELDGYRSGCWVLNDLGAHPGIDSEAEEGSLSNWAFGIGSFRNADTYGTPTFADHDGDGNYDDSYTDVELTFNTGDAALCLCNQTACGATETGWVETYLDSGDWLLFGDGGSNGPTYTNDGNTAKNFPIAQVHAISDSNDCDSATGRQVFLNVADFDAPATISEVRVFEVLPEQLAMDITVTGGSWAPQNPFTQNGYGANATRSSTCGAWSTNTAAQSEDKDCDTSSMIGMFQGVRNNFQNAAVHYPSAMQYSVLDGQDGCIDCVYQHNYVGPGYAGAGIIDTGTGYSLIENTLDGCQLHDTSTAACIRTLGDNARLHDNLFINVGMGECSNLDPCAQDSDCSSGICTHYPGTVVRLNDGHNSLFRNRFLGITFGDAIVEVVGPDQDISENIFSGVTTRAGAGIVLGSTSSGLTTANVKLTNNRFQYLNTYRDEDFIAWVSIRDATNVVGSGNLFQSSEPSDSEGTLPAPISVGNLASDDMVAEVGNMSWTGSVLRGYEHLFMRDDYTNAGGRCTDDYTNDCDADSECTGDCTYVIANDASVGADPQVSGNLVSFPPGSKTYEMDGLFLNDVGAMLHAEKPTCDRTTKGWRIVVGDSGSCTSDDTSELADCYCTGSAWAAVP
jgi:hypothetical protein